MKTGLIRAFLFSLIVFFILNFLFTIIGNSIYQSLEFEFTRFAEHPTFIIFRLIYPFHSFPWDIFNRIITVPEIGIKTMYIGYFISLVMASIIAGFTGGEIVKSVGGWILTSITCILLFIIIITIDVYNKSQFCVGCSLDEAIIYVIIPGVVNLLIFGVLAALIGYIRGRS